MTSTIVAKKALFIPTGTYGEQYIRPYSTTLNDASVLEHMRLQTGGGQNLEATNLAGIAGSILAPTAQAVGNAMITNGWCERRYRFMIELEVKTFQTVMTQILTGYTDYMGATANSVDPNMRLFFNNTMTLRTVRQSGPRGDYNRTMVTENAQLLSNPGDVNNMPTYGPYSDVQQSGMVLLRPEDVFCRMSTLAADGQGGVHDLRTVVPPASVKKSNRHNGDASVYLSKTLKAYKSASRDSEMSNDPMDMANSAAGIVRSGDLYNDSVFHRLSTHTDYQVTGSVSYASANEVFGGLDQVAHFIALPEITRTRRPHEIGDTEGWHSATSETMAATILSSAVPTIMADTLLTRVRFHAHNNTLDGSINFALAQDNPANSFVSGISLEPYLEIFRDRLVNVVLRDISHQGQMQFAVTMDVDLLGETSISISLNGYAVEHFTMPSFSDSLFTPVVTNKLKKQNTLSFYIDNLANNILLDGTYGY